MFTSAVSDEPTIGLCVIARDEEAFIGDCLASAQPYVDELVVLDTGSVDRTRAIAAEAGARVETFAWCDDFAAARNAAIEAARCDWILMLDADERLAPESGPRLRPLAAAAPPALHCYLPRIENAVNQEDPSETIVSFHTRFFPRRETLRFRGAIHEDLKYLPDPTNTQGAIAQEVRIFHSGYLPEQVRARGKDERNSRLLERALRDRPGDAHLAYYAGSQHAYMKRYAEAAALLWRSVELAGERIDGMAVDAYTVLALTLYELGDGPGLSRLADRGARLGALSARAREILAKHHARAGANERAEAHLLAALEPGQVQGVTQLFPGAGGWHTRSLLADLYRRMGQDRRALEQIEIALAAPDVQGRQRIARVAAQVALKLGDAAAAERWLEEAGEDGDDSLETYVDLLAARYASPPGGKLDGPFAELDRSVLGDDWQAAYEAAMALPLDDVRARARILYVADRLRQGGAPDAALDLLGRALDRAPSVARVHLLLSQVLRDLGRYEDALAALEVLGHLPGTALLDPAA